MIVFLSQIFIFIWLFLYIKKEDFYENYIFLIIFIACHQHNFPAGIIVTSEFPTMVTVHLDNGEIRSKTIDGTDKSTEKWPFITPGESSYQFVTDAFLPGFRSIEWEYNHNQYTVLLDIPGIAGWSSLKIHKNDTIQNYTPQQ